MFRKCYTKRTSNIQVRHRRTCREARAPKALSSACLKRGTPPTESCADRKMYGGKMGIKIKYTILWVVSLFVVCFPSMAASEKQDLYKAAEYKILE